jgi:methionine synthase I (cobalamin-dependent)
MITPSFLLSLTNTLILDGATGTELNRRGVDTGLPLWSTNALLTGQDSRILQQIHEDYLRAGADILTTNTFRTHRRALVPSGNADRALELTHRAVDIARDAIRSVPSSRTRYVAGSISTLEDCYRPDLVPSDDQLLVEHSERVQHLLQCGVDVFLVETINTIREAVIIATQAVSSGMPVMVSFVCNREGRILSGETLTDAARALLPLGVNALGINCVAAPDLIKPLSELAIACPQGFPLIAYGNIGYADETAGWVNTDAVDPDAYCRYAATWPARIIGGCCGTTPAHIARLHKVLSGRNP